jgi:hypothetical protein
MYDLTGLIWAARKGKIDVARVLLAAGADLGAMDRRNRTAFFHAVALNQHAFVQYLASVGADVNSIDTHGWTPLDLARGHERMVALLQKLGGRWAHYEGPPETPTPGTNRFIYGCGATGGWVSEAATNEQRQLGFLMRGWTGHYTSAVETFAFRPFVDGSVARYTEKMNLVGAGKATRSKDWLTVKIAIPVSWWQCDPAAYKQHLTDTVDEGLHKMLGLLQRNRHPIDAELLLADWEIIKQLFLSTPPPSDRDKDVRAALLALSSEAASAVAKGG